MQTNLTLPSSPRATRREWLGLAVLIFPTLLVSMDSTVTYLALPAISAQLKPTGSQLLWITDIYTFLEGGFLIIMGALGDRIGRKRLLMTGFILFAGASIMAAFAGSPAWLIAARALLGMTGAIILPCTLSLIRSLFHDDRQRTVAFGLYTASYSGGTMLGPLIGGVLLTHFWWGSVFLISVPLMLLFLCASPLLPEYRDPDAKQFSLMNALLLLTGTLSIIYGVKRIAESGSVDSISLTTLLGGLGVSGVFVYSQTIVRNPLLNLSLFRNAAFSVTLATLFLGLFCWAGLYLFLAQYMQLVLGYDPLKAGLLTLLPVAITVAGCILAPQTLRWVSRSVTILLGNVLMLGAIVLLAQLSTATNLTLLIAGFAGFNLGCGIVVTMGIDLVVSVAPHEQAGAASGISESSTTFGQAFGVALLGSVGTAVYRSQMSSFADGTLSDEAHGTLGGALEAAKQLPIEAGLALANNARQAFVDSFHTASLLAAAAILVMIGVFLVIMKRFKK
jgi:DHA2 family multidrug resistance protein-like MFS transporter